MSSFPKEYYVGAFIATTDPNPGPSPNFEIDAWAGRYWRSVGRFFRRPAALAVHLPRRSAPRQLQPHRIHRDTRFSQPGVFRGYLLAEHRRHRVLARLRGRRHLGGGIVRRQPLSEHWAISAGFGHYGLEEVYHDSYNYWNATVTATLAPFELQLAYLGVDDHAADHFPSDSVGDRVALTALWRFSKTK